MDKVVKKILNNCGLGEIFNQPFLGSSPWLSLKVEEILKDQFLQDWHSTIYESSKGNYYNIFKENIFFEKYLYLPKNVYYPILKFRTSNHNLPIETGRWSNIPKYERFCNLCSSPAIGDEFHYLFSK